MHDDLVFSPPGTVLVEVSIAAGAKLTAITSTGTVHELFVVPTGGFLMDSEDRDGQTGFRCAGAGAP